MKTAPTNDPLASQAETTETEAMPQPLKADPKNLAKVLKQFDKIEKSIADAEALKLKLEKEVSEALASGEVDDERLVNSLATKRGQIEMIPVKLAQLEASRAATLVELQAEFIRCLNELEHRFDGMGERIKAKVVQFLKPIMTDDAMVEMRVSSLVMPYAAPLRKAWGMLNYIRHPSQFGNWADAARQWLLREREAEAILAEAEAFGSKLK